MRQTNSRSLKIYPDLQCGWQSQGIWTFSHCCPRCVSNKLHLKHNWTQTSILVRDADNLSRGSTFCGTTLTLAFIFDKYFHWIKKMFQHSCIPFHELLVSIVLHIESAIVLTFFCISDLFECFYYFLFIIGILPRIAGGFFLISRFIEILQIELIIPIRGETYLAFMSSDYFQSHQKW